MGSDINFGVSRSISRFKEYDTISATRGSGKDNNPMQRASREVTIIGQGTKHINRAVIVHNSSRYSSNSAVQGFSTSANSGNKFSREAFESVKYRCRQGIQGSKRFKRMETGPTSV